MIASRPAPARRRARLAALLLVAGGALALAAPLRAQDGAGFDPAEVLPAETLAWMGTRDVQALAAGWRETAQGRFFADPAFEPLFAEIARGLAWIGPRSREELGVDLLELAVEQQGPLGLALLELGASEALGEPPSMALALLAGLRPDAEDLVLERLDVLAERWVEAAPEEVVQTFEERAGVDVALLADPNGSGSLAYAVTEGVLVLTLEIGAAQDAAHVDALLDGLQLGAEHPLAARPAFADSLLGSEAAPGRFGIWLDVPAVLAGFGELGASADDRETVRAEMEAAGLDTLGPLVVGVQMDASGQHQRMEFSWGEAWVAAELVSAIQGGQSPSALAWMPPDVSTAMGAELDLGAFFDEGLATLLANDPEGARDAITGMSEFEAQFGFHPRDDLVEALSGQIGLFSKEPDAGPADPNDPFAVIGTFALTLGLSDAQVFGEFLDAMIRSQGLHVARERELFEGFEVYALPFPLMPGLEIHYSLGGDVLTLSTNGDLVRDVLRRRANPELASLASSEAYRAMRARMPAPATVVFSMDAAESMVGVLELPGLMLGVITMQSGGVPPTIPWGDGEQRLDVVLAELEALMPGPELVRQHDLGQSVTTVLVDGTRVQVHSETP